ncbi:spindle pole body component 110-like [Dorcoceras hygrometricum]|uniref:Spindle pole body component 110-like n=1 Tax=Dorcoceras hygrometricum TaxID=472368 RepID=A0A2Z7BYZ2_9LAMI|nr:spindle pole body component 110-like [Dorcoceras hygrometricum]
MMSGDPDAGSPGSTRRRHVEVKAEKKSYANKAELVSSSEIQATLSKLDTENDELRSRSSASMDKLHGAMKPSGDKTGLGYDGNVSSTAETSCTPKLERTNFKTVNIVKSSTGQPVEAQSGETKITYEPPI